MQFDAVRRARFDGDATDDDVRVRRDAGRDDNGDHYASAVGDDANHGSHDGDGDADDHGDADDRDHADDGSGDDIGVE
ncbi:hypothetical protein [Halobacterium litoreum]|uniref:Uncharacterized protein n=1 Tax=Halobacterium litoreum TaxID=2039234 RepID=A0ABD5NG29_9EURY|nr:hypothetical protein [Halobacterium litoreum]UHH12947.1 hypothetical protein LT972_12375 [Halobacterium litoreum]